MKHIFKFSGCHPLILDSKFTFTLQLSGNDRQKKFCAFGISLRKKGNGEMKIQELLQQIYLQSSIEQMIPQEHPIKHLNIFRLFQ